MYVCANVKIPVRPVSLGYTVTDHMITYSVKLFYSITTLRKK